MRIFTLILLLILFTIAGSAYAQFRDELNNQKSQADVRLTPKMFTLQVSLTDHTFSTKLNFQFFESKASHRVILFGSSILTNKLDFDFRTTSLAAYLTTVTDYNNAVRRQILYAEPTSQQRKSPLLLRFK